MTDLYRNSCVRGLDRLSNEAIGALIAGVVAHGLDASKTLFVAVSPLLMAFYEGQVQAGRVRHEHLEVLVHEAFIAIYHGCASYDPASPIRAWLIEIARCKLLDYLQANCVVEVLRPLTAAPLIGRKAAMNAF